MDYINIPIFIIKKSELMNIKSIGYRIKHFFMHNLVHSVIFFNFLMCSRNMAILKFFSQFLVISLEKGLFEKKMKFFFGQMIKFSTREHYLGTLRKKIYGHYRPYSLVSHAILICYFVRKIVNNTSS
jgi:hypothetical protein